MELRANNATNCEEWVSHVSEEKKKHRTTLRYGLQNIAMEKQKEMMKASDNVNETQSPSANNTSNNNNNNENETDLKSGSTTSRNRKSQFQRQSSKRFKLNSRVVF